MPLWHLLSSKAEHRPTRVTQPEPPCITWRLVATNDKTSSSKRVRTVQFEVRTPVGPKSPRLYEHTQGSLAWDRNACVPRDTFTLPEPPKIKPYDTLDNFRLQRMMKEKAPLAKSWGIVETFLMRPKTVPRYSSLDRIAAIVTDRN